MYVDQQSARKTFKYKMMPSPEQERMLATVVCRCRELYNAGLEERKAAWEKCRITVTFAMQSAQLPAIKEVRPEYAEINAQVLQDVLRRLDKAFATFFRRVKAGERPGYPRFQGMDRYNSFTYPQVGEHGGAALDGGVLTLSKIGRLRLRLHRPLDGIPKTVTVSREADGWYACISCAEVPTRPLPPTGHETGIDVGLKVFLVTADGEPVASRGAIAAARLSPCSSATIRRYSASDATFTTRPRSRCCASMTGCILKICRSAT